MATAAPDRRSVATTFYRRQLVLAGLTAAVVLVASVAIVAAMSTGDGARPDIVLRTAADGSVLAVPSSGDAPGGAVWAAGGALVAVTVLVVVLVGHTVKVARFASQERKES